MANISSDFLGIKSPNPFWLASAPPTDKKINVLRAFEAGWGGVVWKTLGSQVKNVSSRYSALNFGSKKMMGFNNIELISSCQLFLSLSAISETTIALSGKSLRHSAISFRFKSNGRSLMSSILLKPIILCPPKFTAEYLDETFFTWLPNVFQTTPPQPASNARSTLYFLSVGGALASQYGLGDFMPRKFEVMSAIAFVLMQNYEL